MSEPDVSDLISVDEAIAILDAVEVSPRLEEVSLNAADGRVLAEDLRADRDAPPFRKSQMDGFAVRCADVENVPVALQISGEIPAGTLSAQSLRAGVAMAIMTGAPLPDGADGIVPIEFTERDERDPQHVRILQSTTPGRFIAERGSDVQTGAIVLERGTVLRSTQLAVAASIGAVCPNVYARPRVAILTTGDEIVPAGHTPEGAQIRNSNAPLLKSLLNRMGCEVSDLGIIRDDRALIRDAIDAATREHDTVFITGGMSMGEYDYVPKVLNELGVVLKITKIRVKPGKPFVFGIRECEALRDELPSRTFVFGLPGNPVSGFVCTLRLASRLLRHMTGLAAESAWREGVLSRPLPQNGPREFYLPGIIDPDARVTPLAWKGSADIFTLARANVLLMRKENAPAVAVGERVRVLEIPS